MKNLLLVSLLSVFSISSFALSAGNYYKLSIGSKSAFAKDGSLSKDAQAVLWTDTDVPAQRWQLIDKGDGKYGLRNAFTGYYLAYSGDYAEAASVCQRSEAVAGTAAQWILSPVSGKANVFIVYAAKDKKYCLSAEKNPADGAQLRLADPSTADPSLTEWTLTADDNLPIGYNTAVRDAIMDGFINQYYHAASGGHVLGSGGWWGDAEMFETILDAFETTGDKKYQAFFHELYSNFIKRNGTDWTNNEYNDDITWMVLACIRAYKFFGGADYLAKAKKNYDAMYARAKQKYGTLIWKQSQNNKLSTNSCINCPATIAACYLAQLTGDNTYYDKALSIYAGQRTLLFQPSDGHVFDCRAWSADGIPESNYNPWASTYNQGTMLGAAVMLYKYTRNSQYLTDAERIYAYTVEHLCNSDGIISVCQTINGDLTGFKGILMRYIRRYAEDLRHEEALAWIEKNAWQAYQNRTSGGVIWSAWLTKTNESLKRTENNEVKDITNDAFGASTAVSAAFNAHVNRRFRKNAFSTIGAECFDEIQFMQLADEPSDGTTPNTTNSLKNGYICFKNVDFGQNTANQIRFRVTTNSSRSKVAVYLDSIVSGNHIAETSFLEKEWTDKTIAISPVGGVHDVYFVSVTSDGPAFHNFSFGSTDSQYPDLTANHGDISASDGSPADALIDNDPSTVVAVGGPTKYWTYTSAIPAKLRGFSIVSGKHASRFPKMVVLQVSADGNTWTNLASMSPGFTSTSQCNDHTVSTDGNTYTHFRLTVSEVVDNGDIAELAELELYGTGISHEDGIAPVPASVTVSVPRGSGNIKDRDELTAYSVDAGSPIVYDMGTKIPVTGYSLTSSSSEASRDPCTWKMEGSADGADYTQIDSRIAQTFSGRLHTQYYDCNPSATAYRYFRLTVSPANGSEKASIAEWQLLTGISTGIAQPIAAPPSQCSITCTGHELHVFSLSPAVVTVCNVLGVLEHSFHANAGRTVIPLTVLPTGIHIAMLNSGTKVRRKFVIK